MTTKTWGTVAWEGSEHLLTRTSVATGVGLAESLFLRAAGVRAVIGDERVEVYKLVVDIKVADAAVEVLVL